MNRRLIEAFTCFLLFGPIVFSGNAFPATIEGGQDPTVSEILKDVYPSSCSSARAIKEIKWGMSIILPHNIRLISVHPTKTFMGEENDANKDPIGKLIYSDILTCLVSGNLSNNEMFNGFYLQVTHLAPEPKMISTNKVGTYVSFSGIFYRSKHKMKEIVRTGNYLNSDRKFKYLGKIFPGNIKPWVDFPTP